MDKFDQDIIWLAKQMGIPPEIALRIAKEGGMNVPPQTGAAPMDFTIKDDRNLPDNPNYGITADQEAQPQSLAPPIPGLPNGIMSGMPKDQSPGVNLLSMVKSMFGESANPMQGEGVGMGQEMMKQKLIKMILGGL